LNKFSIAGRNAQEEGIWGYIAKLDNVRKAFSALTTGKMMQYTPADGIYVYFRYDNTQTIMTVMNTAKDRKNISPKKYVERTTGFSKMKNILSGEITDLNDFPIDAKGSGVYELMK